MKIKDKREKHGECYFSELGIGQAYQDRQGNICVKTSLEEGGEEEYNCIALVCGDWGQHWEAPNELCTVLNATLLLED